MGGQVDATEDMFAKLESMRAVITEVNTQFKDPVSGSSAHSVIRTTLIFFVGEDDFCLRLHLGIPVAI